MMNTTGTLADTDVGRCFMSGYVVKHVYIALTSHAFRWPQDARISAEAGVNGCKNSLVCAKSLKYKDYTVFTAGFLAHVETPGQLLVSSAGFAHDGGVGSRQKTSGLVLTGVIQR
jgi:hypothetical protein